MTPAEVLQRIQGLLLTPVSEWARIDEEGADIAGLYRSYILPLVGISTLAVFIGASIVGSDGFRAPFFGGLMQAIISLGLGCAAVYGMALIVNALAPQFGAQDE